MNRDVCEHFVPVDLPCEKCKSASVQKSTLREAAQAVLDRWDSPAWKWLKQGPTADLMADLRAALAEPVQEPGAWIHTDPDKPRVKFLEWREDEPGYRGRWIKTPLYTAQQHCPNCASLEDQNTELDRKLAELTEAVMRAHGIGGNDA